MSILKEQLLQLINEERYICMNSVSVHQILVIRL